MPQPFPFELVSPEKLVFSGEVASVQIPGAEGDFEVLSGHAPVLSTLRPGVMTVRAEGAPQRFFIQGGFADASPEGLTVLAGEIIAVNDLTPDRIAREIGEATQVLNSAAASGAAIEAAQAKIETLKQLEA